MPKFSVTISIHSWIFDCLHTFY